MPISYPMPTWSVCKAMFELAAPGFFARGKQPAAFFSATELKIWKPVRFEKYAADYKLGYQRPARFAASQLTPSPTPVELGSSYIGDGQNSTNTIYTPLSGPKR